MYTYIKFFYDPCPKWTMLKIAYIYQHWVDHKLTSTDDHSTIKLRCCRRQLQDQVRKRDGPF